VVSCGSGWERSGIRLWLAACAADAFTLYFADDAARTGEVVEGLGFSAVEVVGEAAEHFVSLKKSL
jgi:hypothetical protein